MRTAGHPVVPRPAPSDRAGFMSRGQALLLDLGSEPSVTAPRRTTTGCQPVPDSLLFTRTRVLKVPPGCHLRGAELGAVLAVRDSPRPASS